MTDLRSRIVQCNTKPIVHENAELGTVHLRRMTLGELDTLQGENEKASKMSEADKAKNPPLPLSVRLLSRFIGDEQGNPEFDLTKPDDVAVLKGLPVAVVADILRAGNRLNNLNAQEDGPGKP
jgi:hypothetical protein